MINQKKSTSRLFKQKNAWQDSKHALRHRQNKSTIGNSNLKFQLYAYIDSQGYDSSIQRGLENVYAA